MLEEAERVSRLGLGTMRVASGERHLQTASAMFNTALILLDLEECDEAESLAEEALSINREIFGESSGELDGPLEILGIIGERTDDLTKARSRYGELVDLRRGMEPLRPASLGCGLSVLGIVVVRDGEPELGLRYIQEADEVMRTTEDHPKDCRVANKVRFGEAYVALGRYDEAEVILLEAQEIYAGPRWPGIVEKSWLRAGEGTASTLEDLYEVWGGSNR